jgi:hypothetical protein
VERRSNNLETRLSTGRLVQSAAGLGVIGVVAGAVSAIGLAAGMAWVVTTVSGLLR